tara:strand:- start:58 stop:276 length:219 start_codon:yes stop_codon:yes gene_type:complete
MNNEGDYLIAVNELRDQYEELKLKYEIEIGNLKQENEFLKEELYKKCNLVFIEDMFDSTRSTVRIGKYVDYI